MPPIPAASGPGLSTVQIVSAPGAEPAHAWTIPAPRERIAVSGDGAFIAFAVDSDRPPPPIGTQPTDVVVADLATGQLVSRLAGGLINFRTATGVFDSSASRLAIPFDACTEDWRVDVLTIEGSPSFSIVASAPTDVKWSPNADHLAVLGINSLWLLRDGDIDQIDPDTPPTRGTLAWSPDGRWISYLARSGGTDSGC